MRRWRPAHRASSTSLRQTSWSSPSDGYGTRHQPLLAEDERVDVVLLAVVVAFFCLSLVENDDARADADFEPVRVVELRNALSFMKNIA